MPVVNAGGRWGWAVQHNPAGVKGLRDHWGRAGVSWCLGSPGCAWVSLGVSGVPGVPGSLGSQGVPGDSGGHGVPGGEGGPLESGYVIHYTRSVTPHYGIRNMV